MKRLPLALLVASGMIVGGCAHTREVYYPGNPDVPGGVPRRPPTVDTAGPREVPSDRRGARP